MGVCSEFHRSSSFVPSTSLEFSPPLSSDTESLLADVDSCDEDDGEVGEGVVEEELADKPETTIGTEFDMLQSILLPFLVRCGFLTAGSVLSLPMILAELPE